MQSSPAVILRLAVFGEADRVVTLFTRDRGKLSALARGARRSQRRFGASLTYFVLGEALWKERPGSELGALDSFEAREDFTRVAADVVAMAHASYGTELVRELTVPHHPEPEILDLLVELYRTLVEHGPRSDTLRAFELRLLAEAGFQPELDRCLGCGASGTALDAPGTLVDPGRGGVLCASCSALAVDEGVRSLPASARARLLEVRGLPLAEAAVLPPLPEGPSAPREAVHALVRAHLRGPLRSLEFLQKL